MMHMVLAIEQITQSAAEALTEGTQNMNILKDYFQGKVPGALDFVLKIAVAVVVFIICSKVIKTFVRALHRSFERTGMEAASANFTVSILRALAYIVLAAVLATFLGVEGTSVAALLGSMGVGIVLALKESLSNIAGGFILLLMKPFVSGDYIHEDTKGNEGTVVKIDLFYTTLLTIDNRTVCIPNGVIANSSLTNISRQDKRQIREKVAISYRADIAQAKKVLEELLKSEESILKEEPIQVVVDSLGDHGVILGWNVWVRPDAYFSVRWRIMEQIKYHFDEAGIEIPYNQLDVYVRKQ